MSSPNPPPDSAELSRRKADLAAAEEKVARLREEKKKLAEACRAEPNGERQRAQTLAAASLSAARDEVDAARAALEVFARTGSPYGIIPAGGKVTGAIAVLIKPGGSRAARERAIDDAISEPLAAAAAELGVVLSAAPVNFARERPGRDSEGRTVFEVSGRVEGDRLLPAVSRAAKSLRR
jgi:hypothetical protein